MRRGSLLLWLAVLVALLLTACGQPTQPAAAEPEGEETTEEEESNMITLTIGEHTIHAELADTAAARELRALLEQEPITMSASNYGGFEKVCSLGHSLTAEDVQTTTQTGDIMLYNGSQVVLFYDSNRWAYTRLGRVAEEEISELAAILSGSEREVLLSLG